MSLLDRELLSLDFWQDSVTYAGHTLPTGSIACDALNITEEEIGQLLQLGLPLARIVELVKEGIPTAEDFHAARDSVLQMTQRMRTLRPFSLFGFPEDGRDIRHIFTKEYTDNAAAYIRAAQELGAAAAFDAQYSRGVGLLKLISELAQLGGTLLVYKQSMTDFARVLHDSERTPEGYAAAFAAQFSPEYGLSPDNRLWMSLTNTTVQYVSARMPERDTPQLVRRMHYMSFVGMFRSDLFEGLCVGHAPRKCPICGRWFLTTNARRTKYCGDLAPGDRLRRTCRQLGNLKGREQRELADDHPLKQVYERRLNTINRYVKRGTLDGDTADKMKTLAKDKMLRAISDAAYAQNRYRAEMEQDALRQEAEGKR